MNLKYWLYRKQWDLAPWILPKNPLHLDLELSSRCQLQCVFCPHSIIPKTFPIGDMPIEMAFDILKQGEGKAKSVKLNWRGESTLYPHLIPVISYAQCCGYVDIMLNTNGNCEWKILEQAIKNGLTFLAFSIDGANEEDYLVIRKGGNYGLVMDNLRRACDMRRDYPQLRVILQATLKNPISEGLERFKVILPAGCELKLRSATWRTKLIAKPEGLQRRDCLMPRRRLLIDWQGNVYPCCADWHGNFMKKGVLPIINADRLKNGETALEWAWKSFDLERGMLKSGEAFNYEPCKSCFSRESWK